MAKDKHLSRLRQSVRYWNHWRNIYEYFHFEEDPTLAFSAVDLSGKRLTDANLNKADLRAANLNGTDLRNGMLWKADLRQATLRGADLAGADLMDADLEGADLTGANLSAANLTGANLRRAHLGGVYLDQANLSHADLSISDMTYANLNAANLQHTNLWKADLCGSIMTNVSGIYAVGVPWRPDAPPDAIEQVPCEAQDVTTPPDRLTELVSHRTCYQVLAEVVANPNLPIATLLDLANVVPDAFLANPVLPFLFLEQPFWIPAKKAACILQAINDSHERASLTIQHAPIIRLVAQCARRSRIS